jgi:hypothetical protein
MPAPGRYESFYLRAVDPARSRGAWIRHTTFRAPDGPPSSALWCTVFDATAGAPWAVKQSFPTATAPGEMGPGRARGAAEAAGRSASWDLEISGRAPALRHLGRAWAYRSPLPRTKLESPRPDAVLNGVVEAGGRRLEVAGWRGMTGHNWGSEHAARWVWLHGTAFADEPGAWLDVALGRVRIGGSLTPWVANGALSLDGRRLRIGGLVRGGARVDARPGGLDAELTGRGLRLRLAVRAPAGQTVAFEYADPGGGHHEVLNCSVAELHLRVERPGRRPLELATAHGGAYELGLPPGTGHGVPLEPFPDP